MWNRIGKWIQVPKLCCKCSRMKERERENVIESSWNVMSHGDTMMHVSWLPVVDWIDALTNLNGLVQFTERQNLVSAHVQSHFKCSLLCNAILCECISMWLNFCTSTLSCSNPTQKLFSSYHSTDRFVECGSLKFLYKLTWQNLSTHPSMKKLTVLC